MNREDIIDLQEKFNKYHELVTYFLMAIQRIARSPNEEVITSCTSFECPGCLEKNEIAQEALDKVLEILWK